MQIESCGKPYSTKVVCTVWREIFHTFRDPPYNMESKSQNK
uniref:ORF40x n=1 Tax=Pinus koraiensis TaxID=88728 RepID=A4QMF6_PINKO|nr:ORF40x [Pinus koraiensis]ABP35493.1 ORF40x [Pinus koraiensis]